jgi:eukaryotic-like serine/threonine-protein kinase
MSAVVPPLPQKLGKYEVRREVGRGGMGIVYEGFDPLIGRRVALKTFIQQYLDNTQEDNLLARLQREAQAGGRLNHPHIIAVFDYGEETIKDAHGDDVRSAFIAMEFVEGRSLQNYFEANERFSLKQVERIMSELLDALGYSHAHGVVHRDIKPANIILLADGSVKVGDFGVARIEASTLTQAGTVLGSPRFMSPEQFMGQTVDGRSDLYSAGIVLYQLLTGDVPFTGEFTTIMHRVLNEQAPPPTALNVQVPKMFDDLMLCALAKRPDERFQTAAAFRAAISAAMIAPPVSEPKPALTPDKTQLRQTTVKLAPRHTMSAAIVAVLTVLIAAAAAYYFLRSPQRAGSADASSSAGEKAAQTAAAGQTGQKAPAGETGPSTQTGAAASAVPPGPAAVLQRRDGSTIMSSVGIARPGEPGGASQSVLVGEMWKNARQRMVTKAVALYVQPSSLASNFGVIRTKLLPHADEFIADVLDQTTPQVGSDGTLLGTLRARVKAREVQKLLNTISADERVNFIRNNGDPKISVGVRILSAAAGAGAGPEASPVAENILKERIRSFGFAVVDDSQGKSRADFRIESEARFKKLSATLRASGLTIEKFVLTSWTVKATDLNTGEEIYHSTEIPEKQSWVSEELALEDVGRLIGAKFSKSFFLEYFDFKPMPVRLRFSALPPALANAVQAEIDANLLAISSAVQTRTGSEVVIDAQLSGGPDSSMTLVRQLIRSLNRKAAAACFAVADAAAPDAAVPGDGAVELNIRFDGACASPASIERLETAPSGGLESI